LRASSDGIVITDINGKVIEASESFCAFLGLDRAGIIATDLAKHLERSGNRAGRRWAELEQRVLSGATSGFCDLQLQTQRGIKRLNVSATPLAGGGLVSVWRDETERERQQRDFRITQYAVDRATDCILGMRPDGRLLYANRSACQTLGYTAKELLAKSVYDIDVGFTSDRWSEQWENIKRRRSYTVESLFKRRDGGVFPVDVSISYRMFGSEAFAYVVARDITRRRQAEEALRLIQDRYEMATRAANAGVWDWDLQTGEFYVDPVILETLGYDDEDGPRDIDSWIRLTHAADRSLAEGAAEACLAGTAQEYSLEYRVLHKDASIRWILSRGKVIRDSAGQPIRVVGTNTDITDRRLAEDELRDFRVIADNANYGMGVADLAGNLLYLNKSFASVHGYSVDDLLGQNLSVLHSEEQLKSVKEVNSTLLRDGKYGPTEVWHTHRDGTSFPMLMTGITIPDDSGAPMIMAATAIDISDRVRADKALKAREHQQAVVAALGRSALAGEELDCLLKEAANAVTSTLDIELCGIVELGSDGREFVLREGTGWSSDHMGRPIVDADTEWQGGLALRESRTVAVTDWESERRFSPSTLFVDHDVKSSVTIPIRGWGRPYGVLAACDKTGTRVFEQDDLNFLEGVANILAHAAERQQAEEALAASQERLRNLAARLHAVREEERRVIAREIHDQLGQALTGMKMDLSWLMRRLPDDESVRVRAESMQSLLDTTVESVRTISTQLRPPILDDLGLEAAVEWQTTEFGRQSGLNCELDLRIGDRFVQNEHATAAFRILQEALVNVARHAHAENVRVEISVDGDTLFLEVGDDGCGIGDATLSSARSIGLIGMRERAVALGGEVNIGRGTKGGTVVRLELPIQNVT